MTHEPDDPKRTTPKPPELTTMENIHVRQVAKFLRENGMDKGRVRSDYKEFMILAWMAETNLHVSDVVLVEEKLDLNRTVWFFAEKLPRDERFAQQFVQMQAQHGQMKDDLSRALNKAAALEQELAQYRGEPV